MFKIACEEFCPLEEFGEMGFRNTPFLRLAWKHIQPPLATEKGGRVTGWRNKRRASAERAGTMAAAKEEKEDELSAGAGLCGGVRTIRLCSGS